MKLFMEFGAMTLGDLTKMINELRNHYYQEADERYNQLSNLQRQMDHLLNTHITALSIDVLSKPELRQIAEQLQEVMEEYYDYKDKMLQPLKYQMEQAKFVASYAAKAVKAYDKIQAQSAQKAVGKGKR